MEGSIIYDIMSAFYVSYFGSGGGKCEEDLADFGIFLLLSFFFADTRVLALS